MKSPKTNPITNMAKTLAKTSKPAKSTAVSLTDLEILDLINDSAKDILAISDADAIQKASLESLNNHIACLHTGGVRFADGRKKDPATATAKQALFDSLGDKKATYKQDIWEMFFKAVNTGKALTTLNKKRNAEKSDDAKGAKKSKGGNDDDAKMTGALLNVWKLSDVASDALTKIESSIDDGMSLIDAIADYLKSEGVDIE
jgi:hypothetical protein